METVPLVMWRKNEKGDLERVVIGSAVVSEDGEHVSGTIHDRERFKGLIDTMGGDMFSIGRELTPALDHKRPCFGKNVNVCVAEGCFNYSCLQNPETD